MEYNREYDFETEAKIGLPPIKEVPTFQPHVSVENMEQLMKMDENLQPLAMASAKAFSLAEQRGAWRDEKMVELYGAVREFLREKIQGDKDKSRWLIETGKMIASAAVAAFFLWLFKAL